MSNIKPIRSKFTTRTIRVIGQQQIALAMALLPNLPIDPEAPVEIVIREENKVRGLDANSRMWAGQLNDIEKQAWVNGRQFSAEVWHEHFKRQYLPEDNDPDLAELAKEGYRKWDYDPAGNRVVVGSTTQLTRKGFAIYLQQVEADGADMGVQFHEAPKRWAA